MPAFPVHTRDTAPPDARESLDQVQAKFGFIPNILGVMAGAPALLRGYVALSAAFEASSLSPAEQTVVLMAASFENGCRY